MKHSIKNQYAAIFIALMAGTILLCWFLNNTLLEKYYAMQKQNALLEAYTKINAASNEGYTDSEKFQLEIQRICDTYNISLLILDKDSRPVTSSVQETKLLEKELMDSIFGNNSLEDALVQSDNYVIQNSVDTVLGSHYIEMWGILDNGNPFIIRTMLEGIKDSVQISNRFLAYIGFLSAILSGFIIWVISHKMTKPILQLAAVSQKMNELDFEAKYSGHEKNEIGLLGNQMNQMSDTLKKTISELKTANNELQTDIEKKEQIDAMRQEFLSNVSHELKTPIALIMGYAEGLKFEVNDDPESREFYCDVILDETQKMDALVKQLLSLNQIEFGNEKVTMERFDLTETIRNYISSIQILLKQENVECVFDETQTYYAWGDEFRVEEVIMNYVTNALHYCMENAENTKRVEISIRQIQEDTLRVCVFNTGNPIPEEDLPHLWEKFYKVDKARTREYGGSGIGLSIVKAIMESMNQKYGVENREDGVEFWFELECK